jgi:hypothetical protein
VAKTLWAERSEVAVTSLQALIAARYAPPQFATMFEVANNTGFNVKRWADAVSIGIWPSRGFKIHGFECKESRSDWLRELANPEKSEPVFRYCDFWWLVVRDKKIVLGSELPETWGLMVAKDDKLRVVKDAPALTPVPMAKPFVAAMLRRVAETTVPKIVVDARLEQALADRRKQRESSERYELGRAQQRIEALEKVISDFQEASGIHLDQWSYGRGIGEAVRKVVHQSNSTYLDQAKLLRDQMQRMIKDIDDTLAVAEEVRTKGATNGHQEQSREVRLSVEGGT